MYLNGFSVRIDKAKEEPSQYFKMNHGQKYKILLRNHNDIHCDAKVEVDGKEVGVFRLNPKENLALERPTNDARCFTFYHIDSEESRDVRLDKISKDELGLIRVTFTPGTIIHDPVYWYDIPLCDDRPSPLRSDDFHQTEWTSGTYKYDNSYKTSGTTDLSTSNYCYVNDNTKSFAPIPIRTTSLSLCPVPVSKTKQRKAGGTGLSGNSNQKFYHVSGIDYDYDKQTEIMIRLIPNDDYRKDLSELKPVVKKTSFPKPLWCII